MVENNNFYIEKIECIVFIGYSDIFEDLLTINKKLNIPTKIISSTDQSTDLRLDHIVFDTVDSNFYDYIQNNFNIKNTLFISLGSRLIFNSKVISFLNGNLVNFHGSRLPYDSGGGGFSWRIMRQDRIDNQLVHLVNEGIHIYDYFAMLNIFFLSIVCSDLCVLDYFAISSPFCIMLIK